MSQEIFGVAPMPLLSVAVNNEIAERAVLIVLYPFPRMESLAIKKERNSGVGIIGETDD